MIRSTEFDPAMLLGSLKHNRTVLAMHEARSSDSCMKDDMATDDEYTKSSASKQVCYLHTCVILDFELSDSVLFCELRK